MSESDVTPSALRRDPPQSTAALPEGPVLFVGGHWHARVKTVPKSYDSWKVARPGKGTNTYHIHDFMLSNTTVIRVATLHGFVGQAEVLAAMASAAGLQMEEL